MLRCTLGEFWVASRAHLLQTEAKLDYYEDRRKDIKEDTRRIIEETDTKWSAPCPPSGITFAARRCVCVPGQWEPSFRPLQHPTNGQRRTKSVHYNGYVQLVPPAGAAAQH